MRRSVRTATVVAITGVLATVGLATADTAAAAEYFYTNGPSIPLPANATPDSVDIDLGTHTVYVSDQSRRTVSFIDQATNTITRTVDVGAAPADVAVDQSSHVVYVSYFDGGIRKLDGSTGATLGTIATPGVFPYRLAVDPVTHRVYAADGTNRVLAIIENDTLTATVPTGDNSATDLAVDSGTHEVYVVGRNLFSIIDPATRTVTKNVTVGATSSDVAVDPATHTAFVSSFTENTIYFVDTTTDTVTGTLDTTIPCNCGNDGDINGTQHLAVNSDTSTLLVPQEYLDKVTVIDITTRQITDVVPVGDAPSDIAVDPGTRTAWLPYYGSTPSVASLKQNVETLTQVAPFSGNVEYGNAFRDQLRVTGASGALTYTATGPANAAGPVTVSPSGVVSAPASTPVGTYTLSGIVTDATGGGGSWMYTLSVTYTGPARADVSLDLGAPATGTRGTTIFFGSRLKNAGPSPARQTTAAIAVPAGWTVTDPGTAVYHDSRVLVFRVPAIAVNSFVSVSYGLKPRTVGTARVTGVIGSVTRDPDYRNNTTSATITVSRRR